MVQCVHKNVTWTYLDDFCVDVDFFVDEKGFEIKTEFKESVRVVWLFQGEQVGSGIEILDREVIVGRVVGVAWILCFEVVWVDSELDESICRTVQKHDVLVEGLPFDWGETCHRQRLLPLLIYVPWFESQGCFINDDSRRIE